MGGFVAEAPRLLCSSFSGIFWPSEARVSSRRPGRVAVYLQVCSGRQRRRKTTQKRKLTCGKAPALAWRKGDDIHKPPCSGCYIW